MRSVRAAADGNISTAAAGDEAETIGSIGIRLAHENLTVRIGLLRHFPVAEPFPSGWKTAGELQAWLERYDAAETTVGDFELGNVSWRACLASDMSRARCTATAVFRGEIAYTPLLREAQFSPFQTGSLRLPLVAWTWLLWLSWLTGHPSQRACRDEFRTRIAAVSDRLCAMDRDTLVVSHAGVMSSLSVELRRRGFVGPKIRFAKYAKAYIFERTAAGLTLEA
ncbi:MAG: histidine phosphatase family protein [Pirellulales bacterium]|nr:histidine phosphatase family protein [Pirellulales bacterium]